MRRAPRAGRGRAQADLSGGDARRNVAQSCRRQCSCHVRLRGSTHDADLEGREIEEGDGEKRGLQWGRRAGITVTP
jgi:hypothetical protein